VINVITILLVEDDELVRAMVEDALSEGGFETGCTASGEDAIALLRENKSQYRALVTDINLRAIAKFW